MADATTETATLGGGCFWCLEAAFARLRGVRDVTPGYSGGHVPDPTYRQVCSGATGHAEVVQVAFDPAALPFRDLLAVFFALHDPTTPDRQGADVGTQYRSAVFAHSAEQQRAASDVIAGLRASAAFADPIVTEVVPFRAFYPAEEEHRRYYERHPDRGYCRLVIAPKIAALRDGHRHRLAD